jgi:hypothetical protein
MVIISSAGLAWSHGSRVSVEGGWGVMSRREAVSGVGCCWLGSNNGGLALALFSAKPFFFMMSVFLDLASDGFRSSPLEIFIDWRIVLLDIWIRWETVVCTHIISFCGFKRARCDASFLVDAMRHVESRFSWY